MVEPICAHTDNKTNNSTAYSYSSTSIYNIQHTTTINKNDGVFIKTKISLRSEFFRLA